MFKKGKKNMINKVHIGGCSKWVLCFELIVRKLHKLATNSKANFLSLLKSSKPLDKVFFFFYCNGNMEKEHLNTNKCIVFFSVGREVVNSFIFLTSEFGLFYWSLNFLYFFETNHFHLGDIDFHWLFKNRECSIYLNVHHIPFENCLIVLEMCS